MDPNTTNSGGVEFERYRAPQVASHQTPAMVRLIIKISGGAIKDEKQANMALFIIAIIFFIASFFFWFK